MYIVWKVIDDYWRIVTLKLKTDCELIFFASSSGHCTFNCRYCIINPIAKHQPSLNFSDLEFLLKSINYRKAFLAFSGIGDFFAGYRKSEQLLTRMLEYNVEIALDTNGSILQEFPEMSPEKLAKIRYINLTMHYHQLKEKNLLSLWARNARIFHELKGDDVMQDYVMSPLLNNEWEEALAYYDREVFSVTSKKILLVRDIIHPLSPEDENRLQNLSKKFEHMVAGTHQEDFSSIFIGKNEVLCPAGHSYFRIWNDGRVQGCPNLPEVKSLSNNGNLKKRQLMIQARPFPCNTPQYCDCFVIYSLGKMIFRNIIPK